MCIRMPYPNRAGMCPPPPHHHKQQLSQLLAAEGLTDAVIVGHSMGGLVAAEAMIR